MKVLMIAEKDAANVSLSRIAEKLIARGNLVVLYSIYNDEGVLRYFPGEIERHMLSDLTKEQADGFDCIFTSTVSASCVINKFLVSLRIPIFTHNYLVDGYIQWGGDCCFVSSFKATNAPYDEYIPYCKFEIGDPKYDVRSAVNEVRNRLLFIDSGHYPFGMDGKYVLARTLLKICRDYPDYELWIKPRFLPSDNVVTHGNMQHIYSIIEDEADGHVPSNMVMLHEHLDLRELVDSAHCVLTLFTSAFLSAVVSKKGLVVLDNIPSEDIYDVRKKSFDKTRELIIDSGALVDYHNVSSLLPHGILCSEEYLNSVLPERDDVAEKICEVTEYLWINFFSQEKFPQICKSSYQDYRIAITEDAGMTWDKWIEQRHVNSLMLASTQMIAFRVGKTLEIDSIIEQREEWIKKRLRTFEAYMKERKFFQDIRDKCIIYNRDKMMDNDVDSGILLNAYYRLSEYDSIKTFSRKNIGAYSLFRGLVAYSENDWDNARYHLVRYIKTSFKRDFLKEISDFSQNRTIAIRVLSELSDGLTEADGRECLETIQYLYRRLFANTVHRITGVEQGHYFASMKWLECRLNGYEFPTYYPAQGSFLVYGAGELFKSFFVRSEVLRSRIAAVVDKYINRDNVYGIPVIKPAQIKQFNNISTIVITVLHSYDEIKDEIMKLAPTLKVIPVVPWPK